jgi:Tfp pilus assembly protein PilO
MNLPFKVTQREKKFLIAGVIVVLFVIAYHGVLWYQDMKKSVAEYRDNKQLTLQKQYERIRDKDRIKKDIEEMSAELKELEKGLLPGDKPPVAAAEVQRELKKMASSLGIEIRTERALNPVDGEFYTGVPVEIGFNASTGELKNMLYKIRTSPMLLRVSMLKIRVTNIRDPKEVFATMVVQGFIKKTEEKETEKGQAGAS